MRSNLHTLLILLIITFTTAQQNISCTTCTNNTFSVWCITSNDTGICIDGDILGYDNDNITCVQWYYLQCGVSGSVIPFAYVVFLALIGLLLILIVLLLVCLCCHIADRGCKCQACCVKLNHTNYKQGKYVHREHDEAYQLYTMNYRDVGTTVRNSPNPTLNTNTNSVSPILPTFNIEDIDMDDLPEEFCPPPKKPYLNDLAKVTEEAYKKYMIQKAKYEQWQNKVLLYYRNLGKPQTNN
eukprot:TRINITY_DN3211_c0_g1_i1.p1 TRINITY_DN3211_c0_g1~~TRINITY_DN3211_c0_g1_i1.p1  ORF type:complete len:240 (+),score=22.08 TRINITY_DN3211_c0_g1_i1:14-733(+)